MPRIRGKHFGSSGKDKRFDDVVRKLSSEFAKLHQRYLNYADDGDQRADCGWYHNERANIGFLAAAAWQLGWVALEEYPMKRKLKNKEGGGRTDLYIGTKIKDESGAYIELFLEAKQTWPSTANGVQAALNVNNEKSALSRAVKVANTYRDEHRKCAVVFVCPELSNRNSNSMSRQYDAVAEAFWSGCRGLKFKKWAAFAFHDDQMQRWTSDKKGRRSYPAIGVVIVVVE